MNKIDGSGAFGTPIQWACAAVGAIAGWFFGDYVAKKFGYSSGWKYWAIRAGVVIGGAVVFWFAGTKLLKIIIKFLIKNPSIIAKMSADLLWFLGLVSNTSIKNALGNIVPNTINHIMLAKHEWNLIGSNTWKLISPVIEYVLKHGTAAEYKAGNLIYTATYHGETVQVVIKFINGILRIVDAWVKPR